jgi:predicted DNA binding CopG/RHH family protein
MSRADAPEATNRRRLQAIQKRALAEGLPYQTVISSLLHKYASGA